MGYVDPNTIHNPAVGTLAPAAWGDQVRDNDVFFHDPPSCRVYNSSVLTISNTTDTLLTFNSERYDTDTMHSTSSNTGRITFTTAGKYLVVANIGWVSNATGNREIRIRLNGATYIAMAGHPAHTEIRTVQCLSTVYAFAAADYVEVQVRQNSGGNLDVDSQGNYTPEFSATWISG